MADFLMPKFGGDMAAGTLVAWRKRPGDALKRGDILAEVETDKGTIDVEVFTAGVLEEQLAKPGDRVAVGAPMARIREAGEPVAATTTPAPVPMPQPQLTPAAPVVPAPAVPAAEALERLRVSPSARQRARELGVDLTRVQGTGRGGAITREDIERAAATPPPAPADRAARMRASIAAAMSKSKREIPHYYLATTIDLHTATAWLAERNQTRPVEDRLLVGVLFVKAVALALKRVPELNALWAEGKAVPSADVHVGVAVALRGGGLIAPALRHADQRGLDELMRDFRDLVQRTRTGGLRASELTDPTVTVTSLGDQGVEVVYGIVNPPQTAIVGFGKVVERPWVVDGQVVARPVVTATLSADHRVTDGHRGGVFLAAVDRLLQEPDKL